MAFHTSASSFATVVDGQRTVISQNMQRSSFWNEQKIPATLIAAEFWIREAKFCALHQAAVAVVTPGWDGYDAPSPNGDAVAATIWTLRKLREANLLAYSVLPSADGGLGITFRGGEGRRAAIELHNDNSASLTLYGKGLPFQTQNFACKTEIDDVMKRIAGYL